MAETTLRDGVREVARQARPSEINPKLEEAVQNQPLLPHLLTFATSCSPLAIGAVVALILLLLMSPMMAGVGLMIVFFGAWFGLALRDYGRGRRGARGAPRRESDERRRGRRRELARQRAERLDHRRQPAPALGQPVLVVGRARRHDVLLEHARRLELAQPLGQRPRRDRRRTPA